MVLVCIRLVPRDIDIMCISYQLKRLSTLPFSIKYYPLQSSAAWEYSNIGILRPRPIQGLTLLMSILAEKAAPTGTVEASVPTEYSNSHSHRLAFG